jgi:hypothetical protein
LRGSAFRLSGGGAYFHDGVENHNEKLLLYFEIRAAPALDLEARTISTYIGESQEPATAAAHQRHGTTAQAFRKKSRPDFASSS